MEDQVPFKVYTVWKEGDKPEVRRFGVEKSVVTSYHYLNAKIQDVFPGLKAKVYSVAWKDEDGDDVMVSSDDEVMTALQALGGDVIKLYVYCKDGVAKGDKVNLPSDNPNETGGPNAVHCGVMCDWCDSPVVGFRYKCTVCDDFDLCVHCEMSGRHPEHCMVRVPSPTMSRTTLKAAIKRSRHFLKTVASTAGEDCPYKKHRRDRSGERRHRGNLPTHATHSPHGGDHRQRPRQRTSVSWLDIFGTYMNEFANLAGDVNIDVEKPKAPETSQEKKPQEGQAKAKTTPESTSEAPKQPEASTSTKEQTQCPFTAANVKLPSDFNLNQVKGMLESYLGCDLSAFIPQPPASAPASASANAPAATTANTSAAASAQTDVEMGQGDRKTSESCNVSIKTESSLSSDERDCSPDKGDDWTMINKEKDLMDTAARAPQMPAAPIGFNLPEEFQERVKISDGGLYPPLNTATAEAEAAPLQAKPPTAAQTAPPQATAAQPKVTPVQKPATAPPQPRQKHPKPHIDAAIQHMLAMGFTNEGGWLTQLLESKDGNIAAVLDLLTPVNK